MGIILDQPEDMQDEYTADDPIVVASFTLANQHARGRYDLEAWVSWLNDGESSVRLSYRRMAVALTAAGFIRERPGGDA